MDSRNLHTQSSSYMGLLNSQEASVLNENFPYESFHSSVNYGESEIPPFNSQHSEDTAVDKQVRRKWTPADDEVVISAWLNTSKDPIVGNSQKGATFWQRVAEYYAASPHGGEDGEKREHLHIKKRWHRINDHVSKFCGAYSAAQRQIASGENDTDVLKKAHDIFFACHNIKFNLEHAWCVLRHEQKWRSLCPPKASGSSKRTNSQTSATNVGDHVGDHGDEEIRPEGIKAAKARKYGAKGKSVAEYTSLWEMKKEDLAMKEKLSKLAILDTLLAKKEALTEAEEMVKDKLLAEYF
ncbi:glutathione S-transferase T3-like [Raphanus sativus]|uniref:Glutathione S-transferase T3-like n=1 Tax=Raphanus sativus TaxID=3726 RepID=A0A6J0N843_RAPSA|nr:glutathione S-transferase T3-like [Raphanus sativus]